MSTTTNGRTRHAARATRPPVDTTASTVSPALEDALGQVFQQSRTDQERARGLFTAQQFADSARARVGARAQFTARQFSVGSRIRAASSRLAAVRANRDADIAALRGQVSLG